MAETRSAAAGYPRVADAGLAGTGSVAAASSSPSIRQNQVPGRRPTLQPSRGRVGVSLAPRVVHTATGPCLAHAAWAGCVARVSCVPLAVFVVRVNCVPPTVCVVQANCVPPMVCAAQANCVPLVVCAARGNCVPPAVCAAPLSSLKSLGGCPRHPFQLGPLWADTHLTAFGASVLLAAPLRPPRYPLECTKLPAPCPSRLSVDVSSRDAAQARVAAPAPSAAFPRRSN